jgi:MFS family permease
LKRKASTLFQTALYLFFTRFRLLAFGISSLKIENGVTYHTMQSKERQEWIIRLLFTTYFGSLGALHPFLPMYFNSLSLGGELIGILGAITQFTQFLVAPLWGILLDKTGNRFAILYVTFLISVLLQLLVCYYTDPIAMTALVFFTAAFRAPVKPLIDSIVMENLSDSSHYGRFRLFGQVGFGLGTGAVGFLIKSSNQQSIELAATTASTLWEHIEGVWQRLYDGFKLPFLCHAVLAVPSFFCIRAFHKIHQQKESKKTETENGDATSNNENDPSIRDGIAALLSSTEAMLFFSMVFAVGCSSGAIENFCYIRMLEMGLSSKQLGMSRMVSSIAGAPMFWFSGQLNKRLGSETVIVLTLLSFAARFILYALMENAWYGYAAETLRGITFAAYWSTAVIHANRVAPKGLGATMVCIS